MGDVTVNYDPVGSGDGRANFIEGGVPGGGSGGAGIDYGNFPMPRGFSFGINMRF